MDSVSIETVTIEVLSETLAKLLTLAREKGWPEDEALRMAFTEGVAYIEGDLVLRGAERADLPENVVEEFTKTARQMMEEATHAAAMKFQAYRLAEDNKVMEMHENALKNTVLMQQNRMNIFREDEEKLKARIRDLESENQRLRTSLPDADSTLKVAAKKRRRLLRFLGH